MKMKMLGPVALFLALAGAGLVSAQDEEPFEEPESIDSGSR